ncbi:hypothetical protein POTOM_035132 [Populus tomentosa]|uniref:CN hydrolase domain-containing protein n=1 Tax=Populus tomentosa TaxID=118781 RepID=A0A8X7Z056_POPTO|nr:hypothetical protein POTOM_035132 [Populus tomentosa]
MKGGREVVVAALQFACTDDISTMPPLKGPFFSFLFFFSICSMLVRAPHKKAANIIFIQITYFPVELVFQAKFAKIGGAIFWDQWFLEEARAMALQDAEILLYPAAIVSEPQYQGLDSCDHWKRVMQGHAGANLVSCCTGPAMEIVAAADDKEEAVLVAKFDLEQIRLMRHSWGVFRDWRPGLYKVLLTSDGSNPVL